MNRQLLLLFTGLAVLSGCDQNSDLQTYVAQVKARPAPPVEPLPTVTPYTPISFDASDKRNPFSTPRPEMSAQAKTTKAQCIQPDVSRTKEELEKYSLDNIRMKGTLSNNKGLWGLVSVPGGKVYRVADNQYIGLNYGKISKITQNDIEINEMIPDGSGCWTNRTTTLTLITSTTKTN